MLDTKKTIRLLLISMYAVMPHCFVLTPIYSMLLSQAMPFLQAVSRRDTQAAQELGKAKPRVIIEALKQKLNLQDFESAAYILSLFPDAPNQRLNDHQKSHLLHSVAEQSGNAPVVKFLVEHGVDLESRDSRGWTPLHRAAAVNSRNCDTISELIKNSADIDALDNEGNTPLHHAAAHAQNIDNIACLIEHGASVNKTNNNGLSPLDYALKHSHIPDAVIKYLLTRGARPQTEQTKTQLDWREKLDWTELIRESELMTFEPEMPEHLARYLMTFQESERGGQRPPAHVR